MYFYNIDQPVSFLFWLSLLYTIQSHQTLYSSLGDNNSLTVLKNSLTKATNVGLAKHRVGRVDSKIPYFSRPRPPKLLMLTTDNDFFLFVWQPVGWISLQSMQSNAQ